MEFVSFWISGFAQRTLTHTKREKMVRRNAIFFIIFIGAVFSLTGINSVHG